MYMNKKTRENIATLVLANRVNTRKAQQLDKDTEEHSEAFFKASLSDDAIQVLLGLDDKEGTRMQRIIDTADDRNRYGHDWAQHLCRCYFDIPVKLAWIEEA